MPLLCTLPQWDLDLHGRVHSVLRSVIASIGSYKHLHHRDRQQSHPQHPPGRPLISTPPSLLPRSRLGEGGREGIESGGPGVGGSLVWKRAGGSAERAARGPAAELGGEGFRSRCGAQGGPDVQRGGEGWWRKLGRDAAAAPAPSPASRIGGGSRPGQRRRRGPTPRVTGAARVLAERRAE